MKPDTIRSFLESQNVWNKLHFSQTSKLRNCYTAPPANVPRHKGTSCSSDRLRLRLSYKKRLSVTLCHSSLLALIGFEIWPQWDIPIISMSLCHNEATREFHRSASVWWSFLLFKARWLWGCAEATPEMRMWRRGHGANGTGFLITANSVMREVINVVDIWETMEAFNLYRVTGFTYNL